MRNRNGVLHVRCYARRQKDGSWFAICLDLNLCVDAGSFAEAKRRLHEVTLEYLVEAYGADRKHLGQLVPRRAPLYFWLEYALLRLVGAVRSTRDGLSASVFGDDVPLAPAT